ncbi:nucleotide exchange factor GrpE [Chloroflexota bacterium]
MTKKEPEEKDPRTELTLTSEEAEEIKQALAEEKEKAENNLANWQRVQADFINYKRRTEQEKEELGKFANSVLILSFLGILDDLERALASIPVELSEGSWIEGIKLIENKFRLSLESRGVLPIEAMGESFDPRFHEAVRQDTGQEGFIIEELQKGYMLHERVLRPSQVVVGNGEKE